MDYLSRLEKKLIELDYDNNYKSICIKYAKKLLDNEVLVVFDKKHLSLLMGIDLKILNYYIVNTDEFYNEKKIPKKNGRYRIISMPSYNLKRIQRWILDNILYKLRVHSNATGFIRNKSIVDNASCHVNKDVVVNIDISDFFPSIDFDKVFYMFYNLGYTKELCYALSKLLTYKGILPQGAPSSPYIANVIMINIDLRLDGLTKKINSNYTRYADDITISGNKYIVLQLPFIKTIIESQGFKVNLEKLKIQYRKSRQEVTGLVVNDRTSVKREFKKNLRQHIYYCKRFGVYEHLKYTGNEEKSFYKEYLYGHAYFIKMVEPECGERFIKELDSINWDS
ncbi:TPA: retron St85 family RNA-directed DNA polymerase [Clostridioides difficile]|nr:retron St85 family RNA-directed DNA polymerase [Clostridioides difficile]